MILVAIAGCSLPSGPTSAETRAARHAVERYLAALSSHDAAALRELSTDSVSDAAIQGATLLRLGAVRRVWPSELDSLAARARDELEESRAAWTRATENDADSLWLRERAVERRAGLYQHALDAARRSGATTTNDSAAADSLSAVRVCRARVRIRWGGPLVGPEPVDREHVVRLLAIPGGRWIVFSRFLRQDDPGFELD